METRTPAWRLRLGALALGICVTACGQTPVITSFNRNGVLVCSNMAPGTAATVEWAPSVTGPWTNSWAGLELLTVDSNSMIQVSVPMFYRVVLLPPLGMVLIPAGSFSMGDTFVEGESNELPLHTNYLNAFYMDKHEVTKTLWDTVYRWAITNGYDFDNAGLDKATNHPVQTVNWYDAVKWSNARSEKEGLPCCYYIDGSRTTVYRSGRLDLTNGCVNWAAGYRLPTEAEWEDAARGGASEHRFPWSVVDTISHSRANYNADTNSYAYDVSLMPGYHPVYATGGFPYTSPVGSFAANGYGLYDMAGNVFEWCWDWYDDAYYTSSPGTDPRGPSSGTERVLRGGSWANDPYDARCANRSRQTPAFGHNTFGFRCVRGL